MSPPQIREQHELSEDHPLPLHHALVLPDQFPGDTLLSDHKTQCVHQLYHAVCHNRGPCYVSGHVLYHAVHMCVTCVTLFTCVSHVSRCSHVCHMYHAVHMCVTCVSHVCHAVHMCHAVSRCITLYHMCVTCVTLYHAIHMCVTCV